MKIIWDSNAKAVYISLTDKQIYITREISNDLLIDLDIDGKPVGIDILSVDSEPVIEDITSKYNTKNLDF